MEEKGKSLADAVGMILSESLKTSNGELHRTCPHCKRDIPPHKLENPFTGKVTLVPVVCKCETLQREKEQKEAEERIQKKETERLFSFSKIGARFEGKTFSDFLNRPRSEKALSTAKRFAESFSKETKEGLCLWGVPGNGKTELAGMIANTVHTAGFSVVFIKVSDLFERLRSTFDRDNKEKESQVMKALRTCDLLILDEVGSEKFKDVEWKHDAMLRVIDGRYVDLKPIVVTSNIAMSQLDGVVGERIQDRLYQMCEPVKNEATSYRKELREKKARGEA